MEDLKHFTILLLDKGGLRIGYEICFEIKYLVKNRTNIAETFPRFLDIKGLISLEFTLMYPEAKNTFVDKFLRYIPIINKVYTTTAAKIDTTLIESIEDGDEWNTNTKSIIILVHLLPPTSSKNSKKKVHQRLYINL